MANAPRASPETRIAPSRTTPELRLDQDVALDLGPRAEKSDIANKVLALLQARANAGPAEPALDAYIPELTTVQSALSMHVEGNTATQAQRAARLMRVEKADDEVDRWYRHIESYLQVEALMRTSEQAHQARILHSAAFSEGLSHIDDPVADENRACRHALGILQSAEHQATLAGLEFPLQWLNRWTAALEESDAAVSDLEKARNDRQAHIDAGRDAEDAWVETFVRLRKYVASRAKKSDPARIQEGQALLAPLLDVLKKMAAVAATRATKRQQSGP